SHERGARLDVLFGPLQQVRQRLVCGPVDRPAPCVEYSNDVAPLASPRDARLREPNRPLQGCPPKVRRPRVPRPCDAATPENRIAQPQRSRSRHCNRAAQIRGRRHARAPLSLRPEVDLATLAISAESLRLQPLRPHELFLEGIVAEPASQRAVPCE